MVCDRVSLWLPDCDVLVVTVGVIERVAVADAVMDCDAVLKGDGVPDSVSVGDWEAEDESACETERVKVCEMDRGCEPLPPCVSV